MKPARDAVTVEPPKVPPKEAKAATDEVTAVLKGVRERLSDGRAKAENKVRKRVAKACEKGSKTPWYFMVQGPRERGIRR